MSETAAGVLDSGRRVRATMVPALRPVAAEVVRRARLRRGEHVLDVGTGTGLAAAAAVGDGTGSMPRDPESSDDRIRRALPS